MCVWYGVCVCVSLYVHVCVVFMCVCVVLYSNTIFIPGLRSECCVHVWLSIVQFSIFILGKRDVCCAACVVMYFR